MTLKYTDEYARKFTFAEEAVKVVKSGDRVIYAFGICSINELDRALAMRKDELLGVDIICNDLSCGYYTMDADFSEEHFRFFQEYPEVKERSDKGVINDSSSDRGSSKKVYRPSCIFMATVSPMDRNGLFWFDGQISWKHCFRQYCLMADCFILEVNERISQGSQANQECINISKVDIIVPSNNDELIQRWDKPHKYHLFGERKRKINKLAI
jgi:acyl-CoA hydrolase